LEEAFSMNKQLHARVVHLETELGDIRDVLQGLLEFKIQATKLLQVLVLKHDIDELKNQVLSLALLSDDPNAFLKSVVDGEQESNQASGNGENMGTETTYLANVTDVEKLQSQLRDSKQMKDACNDALLHLFRAVKELKPEHTLYPHGITQNDPGWPGEGVGSEHRTYIQFNFTKPYDNPINIDVFKEFCKFVCNHGGE
ncbi:hypothetical protein FRC11_000703, partial [Ceratobasidium sp. 423]